MKRLSARERRNVASVFYDENVKEIWFQLGDLRIEGKELQVVGKLINNGKIGCFGNVPDTLLKGREAEYDSDKNAFLFSPEFTLNRLTVLMESIVLHEGVHAFLDYKKLSKTTYLHNEAAAYVTQAIFLRHKKTAWPKEVKQDPILKAVEDLVDKFKMTSNKAWLNWAHFEPLMKAIQSHPIYLLPGGYKMPWKTMSPFNGIAMEHKTGGLVNKRALAEKQRGPMGIDPGYIDESSRKRGPLGFA